MTRPGIGAISGGRPPGVGRRMPDRLLDARRRRPARTRATGPRRRRGPPGRSTAISVAPPGTGSTATLLVAESHPHRWRRGGAPAAAPRPPGAAASSAAAARSRRRPGSGAGAACRSASVSVRTSPSRMTGWSSEPAQEAQVGPHAQDQRLVERGPQPVQRLCPRRCRGR